MSNWQKARMISDRLNSINTKDFGKKAEEFGRFMEFAGQVQTDSSWVSSMINAGVPHDTILKVWDLKDEAKRKSKNP